MGPSSQGNNNNAVTVTTTNNTAAAAAATANLAVERYLGSCLISSASRKPKKPPESDIQSSSKSINHRSSNAPSSPPRHGGGANGASGGAGYMVPCEYRNNNNGWTGMPLISMASTRRSKKNNNNNNSNICHQHQQPSLNRPESAERSPLSRLAIHTQGAPLILTANNYGRKGRPTPSAAATPLRLVRNGGELTFPRHPRHGPPCHGGGVGKEPSSPGSPPASDCLSVASDESSGHSENSLPRIIKPRKRRKKERKPSSVNTSPANSEGAEGNNNNSVAGGASGPNIVTLQPYVPLCYEFEKFRQRGGNSNNNNSSKKVIETPEIVATPPLPTESAPVEEYVLVSTAEEVMNAPSACQCRYCDPAGLIWDVERSCYSPSLTPPVRLHSTPRLLTSLPLLKANSPMSPSSSSSPAELLWFLDPPHVGLRRSQSEPASHHPHVYHHLKDTTVDAMMSSRSSVLPPVPQELEVSSEIVTSLNGHRDIEIKFFLPSESSREE